MANLIGIWNVKRTKVNVTRAVAIPTLLLVLPHHFLLPPPQYGGVCQSPAGKATTPGSGKKEEVFRGLGLGMRWSPEGTNVLPDGTKLLLHGRLSHPGQILSQLKYAKGMGL